MFDVGTVTLWLQENPDWIALGLFAAAFVESFALIGVVIPGVVLVGVISGLAASTDLTIVEVILIAYIASFLADSSSFFIGKSISKKIDHIWPFNSHPHWLDQGRSFFIKYGTLGLFVGKFIGPIRPLMPITAGSLEMNTKKFIFIDLFSSILWALLYTLPGYLGGKTLLAMLEGEISDSFVISGIALLIAVILIFLIIKRKASNNG